MNKFDKTYIIKSLSDSRKVLRRAKQIDNYKSAGCHFIEFNCIDKYGDEYCVEMIPYAIAGAKPISTNTNLNKSKTHFKNYYDEFNCFSVSVSYNQEIESPEYEFETKYEIYSF